MPSYPRPIWSDIIGATRWRGDGGYARSSTREKAGAGAPKTRAKRRRESRRGEEEGKGPGEEKKKKDFI